MNRNLITFSANEQTLIKTGGINNYASNTVSYIVAEFDLGENWDEFDSVRAIFQSDFETAPAVLAHGYCVIPFEVLRYRSTVRVNLVGSVAEQGVLIDRLTTFPITALNVTADALVDNSIAPISPSEFEEFVAMVRDDADRAEAGAESAESSASAASTSAQSAEDSALSASNSASDASASAQTAQEEAQKITGMVVVVTQLPEGATPTSDWSDGVLTIGIPKGDTGETGATGNGIESAVLNANYTLTLTFTDGTSYTTPSIRGATGATGATGNGISSVTLTSTSGAVKTYTIAFTDGTNTTFDVTDGEVTQAVLDEEITALKSDLNILYYKKTQEITGSYTFPCTIIAGEKYVVTNNASANASCNTANSSGTTVDSLGNISKNGGTAEFTATANAVQLKGWTGGSGDMTIERLSSITPKMQVDITEAKADIEQNAKTINNIATGTDLIKGSYVNAGTNNGQLVPSQTYRVTSSDFISYDRIVKIFPKDSGHKIYLDLVSDEEVYQTSIYILPNQFRFVAAGQKFRLSIVTTGEEIWGTYADIDEYVNAVGVSNIYSDILAHNVLSPFNKPFMGSSRIKIAQHRGWHDETTIFQNTNKAFEAAGKKQAWAIETDIWETTDNHFVIMHDQDVSTTTDGSGNISDMTLAQVEALTITNDPTQHVPTLEEYLGICKTYGCVPLIEIKGFQSTTASAQRLVNVLSDFGLLENCMLITPAFILEYVRNVTEDVPCVVVVTVSNYETMIGNISRYKNVGLGFDSSGTVTSTIVKDCHDRGYLVNVWTTESVESATGYYALGVDFVTSDKLSTSDFLV